MKRIVLATVAVVGFALPALAQQSQQSQPQTQSGSQGSQNQMSGGQASNQKPISAKNLSQSQIRSLQQALNKNGFQAGDADGVWGPGTRLALQKFKQSHGQSSTAGKNQIDQSTLSALGLDASSFGRETTGQGGSSSSGSGSIGSSSSQSH